eukprot:TRINITY_DN64888_c0_g1_i1.p1 TRINITY_DN64888_c0_g1~~TRINITY_DN64888_c0_g1_i1.p1  ORF type:complete len:326 (-),score=47.73 TRINITY_DN64888_c0_g1_i1:197-1174(-)
MPFARQYMTQNDSYLHESSSEFIRMESGNEEESPVPRLPLFSRCPITNTARLETPLEKSEELAVKIYQDPFSKSSFQATSKIQRIPLNSISNVSLNQDRMASVAMNQERMACNLACEEERFNMGGGCAMPERFGSLSSLGGLDRFCNNSFNLNQQGFGNSGAPNKSSAWPSFSSQQEMNDNSRAKARNGVHKPSLDEVRDNSIVALNNKFGKGKYWFKSACPTPDPRWSAEQQLMIGPIPGDVEYSQLRSAFLAQGHTLHLFIQNNQGWLEKNQEKFGAKHVKFGYVVYTERDTAFRLLSTGYVAVGPTKIRVKEMDGKPAVFFN